MLSIIKVVAFWGIVIYLCCVAGLYFVQRKMIYFPNAVDFDLPEGFEKVFVETEPDLELSQIYKAPKENKPVLVFFHGNASNHLMNLYKAVPYLEQGYGMLSVGYRGYNGDAGKPSERGLYQDARAAISYLSAQGFDSSEMIFYGQSLGTGIAVQMALEYPNVQALILESPYTALFDVAAKAYPFIPARLLMRDRFDSLSKIKNIEIPLFIIHGEKDAIVPASLGKKLFEHANEPKEIVLLEQYGHNDIPDDIKSKKVLSFLKSQK